MHANATVITSDGARYRKQLASHLGRKNAVETAADGAVELVFDYGRCSMSVDAATGALELVATATTDGDLEHVKRVMKSHFERFARNETDLVVEWCDPE